MLFLNNTLNGISKYKRKKLKILIKKTTTAVIKLSFNDIFHCQRVMPV